MIHPHTELRFINDEIGHGIFATQLIPKGTIVWAQDPLDREITPAEMEQFDPMLRKHAMTYCYRNRHGHFLLSWDHNRYINHSFNPNCMMTPYRIELAVKDIQPGDQLTDDYGTLNIIESFEPVDEGHARKMVHPDDFERHHQEWDKQLAAAFKHLQLVDQPLRDFLSEEQWTTCQAIAEGKEDMASILGCY
ncbi:MAG: SET domain-containing protein, partial [Kiritimatiellales bacterium]|nr:SET domain-containing protein [Kiritimatiellales bacterium]